MIQALLDDFRTLADPGPYDYEWCHHQPGAGDSAFHVVFGCVIHGNEHGTLPAAVHLVRHLIHGTVAAPGPVTVLLGNTAAALADERFLEEDFNRVFTFDRPAKSLERRLAERVRPILDDANLFLDMHQTQTETHMPFWTFPWDATLGLWARALRAAPVGLTRRAGQIFSTGTCCLDEYVRSREQIGITIELGYRGQDATQAGLALDVMRRAIGIVHAVEGEGQTLVAVAADQPAVRYYRTSHIEPGCSATHRLRPGLMNWTRVARGERLSADDGPLILAPDDGYVLFPKYPRASEPVPPELYRLASEVTDMHELETQLP